MHAPTVLLIEDDPHALEMLRFRYSKEGYQVSEAQDGETGLMKALRKPDLIVLDIRLPKMNGWELCKMLKAEPRTEHIPIIMLTGCSQPVQEQYGKVCGADAYVIKPWEAARLLEISRDLLKKSAA